MQTFITNFLSNVYYGTLNLLFDYDGRKIKEIKQYFNQPLNLEIATCLRMSSSGKKYMTLSELENINLTGDHTFENARKQDEFHRHHTHMFENYSDVLTRIYKNRSVLDFKQQFKDVKIFKTGEYLLRHTYFVDDTKDEEINYKDTCALLHSENFKISGIEISTRVLNNYRLKLD